MLERIQMIDGVGNYSRANAGGIRFEPVTIIYGENRNGKSTLCDIFYSLSLNNPQLVLDRKSIVPNRHPDQVQQRVEIKFSGQQTIRFANNSWESLPPDDSKLYIFDQGFIHRNVMAGTSYSRENSTYLSGFILGENYVQFEALEVRNQQLRTDRRTLANCKNQLETHGITEVDVFVVLPIPTKMIAELDADIQTSKQAQQALATQITNTAQVIQRDNLVNLSTVINIDDSTKNINDCLALSMANVHEKSKAIVTAHKQNLNNEGSFDGWAAKGMTHLDEDCPFCGQTLENEAITLIDSYRTAFDNAFSEYMISAKEMVSRLQGVTLINTDINHIRASHDQNLRTLGTYIEETITEKFAKSNCGEQLNEKFESVVHSLADLVDFHETVAHAVRQVLSDKHDAPYNSLDPIGFDELKNKVDTFNNSLTQYTIHKDQINTILIVFKDEQDVTALQEVKLQEEDNQKAITKDKKRLSLDVNCTQYSTLKSQIDIDKASYDVDKATLEADQEVFLDTYFTEINTLFRAIGSSDFEISRRINRGGARTVYDLEVKFKEKIIDRDKFHCFFSESDRRALALCIFLAKVHQLEPEEQAKAILVMDDPVTSFDNERISSILRILFALKPLIKQVVMTTHYKGMASAVMKKFNDVQAMKIIQDANGSMLEQATKAEMTATAHDERYAEIMDFVGRRTQDNKITKLRPFIEDEMRQRYKLPLINLGLNEINTFNECIEALRVSSHLQKAVAVSLHDYRTTLNLPAHDLSLWSLDDCRTYAEGMMIFIYEQL